MPILATVVVQLALALVAAQLPLWQALLLAALVGSFVSHALGVAIHECSHDLVFRSSWANKLLALVVSVPMGAPGAMTFRAEHLLHHQYLGASDGRDHQAPHPTELGPAGHTLASKLEWLLLALPKPARPHAPKMPRALRPWHVANIATTLALWPVLLFFAPVALVYLLVSTFCAFRLSIVCMRRYAEHVGLAEGQPTSSYYGLLNWVSFFVGYHVEHHDFPAVPWYRLPRLHRLARERYVTLRSTRSLVALGYRFLTDPAHGLDRYTSYEPSRAPERNLERLVS